MKNEGFSVTAMSKWLNRRNGTEMLCVPHLGMPNYGTFWVKTAGPAANITVNGHLIFLDTAINFS